MLVTGSVELSSSLKVEDKVALGLRKKIVIARSSIIYLVVACQLLEIEMVMIWLVLCCCQKLLLIC